MVTESIILSSLYLGPVSYYQLLMQSEKVVILDIHENFVRQTYRNRCCIPGPNGVCNLIIPIKKQLSVDKCKMKDVRIAYDENWQLRHWRTLEATYRNSAYFEFYEDRFKPFYFQKKYDFLVDYNNELLKMTLEILKIQLAYSLSNQYIATIQDTTDYREKITPKEKQLLGTTIIEPYFQVFRERNGFTPNMSIIDVLFNYGEEAKNILL